MTPHTTGHIAKRIVALLLEKPRTKDELLVGVYDGDEPEFSEMSISTSLRLLRDTLEPQGWTIPKRSAGRGKYATYELVKLRDIPTEHGFPVRLTSFETWIVQRLKKHPATIDDLVRETESNPKCIMMTVGRVRNKIKRCGWTIPKQQSRRKGARHIYRLERLK